MPSGVFQAVARTNGGDRADHSNRLTAAHNLETGPEMASHQEGRKNPNTDMKIPPPSHARNTERLATILSCAAFSASMRAFASRAQTRSVLKSPFLSPLSQSMSSPNSR